MKKNLPLQTPSKKVLSYKTILNTNYPGTSPRSKFSKDLSPSLFPKDNSSCSLPLPN